MRALPSLQVIVFKSLLCLFLVGTVPFLADAQDGQALSRGTPPSASSTQPISFVELLETAVSETVTAPLREQALKQVLQLLTDAYKNIGESRRQVQRSYLEQRSRVDQAVVKLSATIIEHGGATRMVAAPWSREKLETVTATHGAFRYDFVKSTYIHPAIQVLRLLNSKRLHIAQDHGLRFLETNNHTWGVIEHSQSGSVKLQMFYGVYDLARGQFGKKQPDPLLIKARAEIARLILDRQKLTYLAYEIDHGGLHALMRRVVRVASQWLMNGTIVLDSDPLKNKAEVTRLAQELLLRWGEFVGLSNASAPPISECVLIKAIINDNGNGGSAEADLLGADDPEATVGEIAEAIKLLTWMVGKNRAPFLKRFDVTSVVSARAVEAFRYLTEGDRLHHRLAQLESRVGAHFELLSLIRKGRFGLLGLPDDLHRRFAEISAGLGPSWHNDEPGRLNRGYFGSVLKSSQQSDTALIMHALREEAALEAKSSNGTANRALMVELTVDKTYLNLILDALNPLHRKLPQAVLEEALFSIGEVVERELLRISGVGPLIPLPGQKPPKQVMQVGAVVVPHERPPGWVEVIDPMRLREVSDKIGSQLNRLKTELAAIQQGNVREIMARLDGVLAGAVKLPRQHSGETESSGWRPTQHIGTGIGYQEIGEIVEAVRLIQESVIVDALAPPPAAPQPIAVPEVPAPAPPPVVVPIAEPERFPVDATLSTLTLVELVNRLLEAYGFNDDKSQVGDSARGFIHAAVPLFITGCLANYRAEAQASLALLFSQPDFFSDIVTLYIDPSSLTAEAAPALLSSAMTGLLLQFQYLAEQKHPNRILIDEVETALRLFYGLPHLQTVIDQAYATLPNGKKPQLERLLTELRSPPAPPAQPVPLANTNPTLVTAAAEVATPAPAPELPPAPPTPKTTAPSPLPRAPKKVVDTSLLASLTLADLLQLAIDREQAYSIETRQNAIAIILAGSSHKAKCEAQAEVIAANAGNYLALIKRRSLGEPTRAAILLTFNHWFNWGIAQAEGILTGVAAADSPIIWAMRDADKRGESELFAMAALSFFIGINQIAQQESELDPWLNQTLLWLFENLEDRKLAPTRYFTHYRKLQSSKLYRALARDYAVMSMTLGIMCVSRIPDGFSRQAVQSASLGMLNMLLKLIDDPELNFNYPNFDHIIWRWGSYAPPQLAYFIQLCLLQVLPPNDDLTRAITTNRIHAVQNFFAQKHDFRTFSIYNIRHILHILDAGSDPNYQKLCNKIIRLIDFITREISKMRAADLAAAISSADLTIRRAALSAAVLFMRDEPNKSAALRESILAETPRIFIDQLMGDRRLSPELVDMRNLMASCLATFYTTLQELGAAQLAAVNLIGAQLAEAYRDPEARINIATALQKTNQEKLHGQIAEAAGVTKLELPPAQPTTAQPATTAIQIPVGDKIVEVDFAGVDLKNVFAIANDTKAPIVARQAAIAEIDRRSKLLNISATDLDAIKEHGYTYTVLLLGPDDEETRAQVLNAINSWYDRDIGPRFTDQTEALLGADPGDTVSKPMLLSLLESTQQPRLRAAILDSIMIFHARANHEFIDSQEAITLSPALHQGLDSLWRHLANLPLRAWATQTTSAELRISAARFTIEAQHLFQPLCYLKGEALLKDELEIRARTGEPARLVSTTLNPADPRFDEGIIELLLSGYEDAHQYKPGLRARIGKVLIDLTIEIKDKSSHPLIRFVYDRHFQIAKQCQQFTFFDLPNAITRGESKETLRVAALYAPFVTGLIGQAQKSTDPRLRKVTQPLVTAYRRLFANRQVVEVLPEQLLTRDDAGLARDIITLIVETQDPAKTDLPLAESRRAMWSLINEMRPNLFRDWWSSGSGVPELAKFLARIPSESAPLTVAPEFDEAADHATAEMLGNLGRVFHQFMTTATLAMIAHKEGEAIPAEHYPVSGVVLFSVGVTKVLFDQSNVRQLDSFIGNAHVTRAELTQMINLYMDLMPKDDSQRPVIKEYCQRYKLKLSPIKNHRLAISQLFRPYLPKDSPLSFEAIMSKMMVNRHMQVDEFKPGLRGFDTILPGALPEFLTLQMSESVGGMRMHFSVKVPPLPPLIR